MVLRIVLGAVYLGMAAGQLASWRQMPAILGGYDAVPHAGLRPLAVALLVGEVVCGVWFLTRPRSRSLSPVWVYTAVSLVWAVLGLQAYLQGVEVANCGCFGVYLTQRLSWFVLAQDTLVLAYAGLMIRSGMRVREAEAREEVEVG
jgi:hypothetical protein